MTKTLRWYIFVVITAVIVGWITIGDYILVWAKAPLAFLGMKRFMFWGMTAGSFSIGGWFLTQNVRWVDKSIRRWQTYTGLILAAIGAFPSYVVFQIFKQLIQGSSPQTIMIVLAVAAIIGKVAIIGYWSIIILPAVYRRLLQREQ